MSIGGGILGRKFGFFGGAGIGQYTNAWYTVVLSRGGSATDAELNNWTTFENNVTASELSEFDRLNQFGLSNNIAARTSFVNPSSTSITAVNNPTFTAYQGYNGNSTTSYLNTNFTATVDAIKYTNTNCSIGVYSLTDFNADKFDIGVIASTSSTWIDSRESNVFYADINKTIGGSISNANASSLGFFSVSLNSGIAKLIKNGTVLKSQAHTPNSLPILPFFICGLNNNGSFGFGSPRIYSLSFLASGNVNQSNFYNAVQALGTAQGWAV